MPLLLILQLTIHTYTSLDRLAYILFGVAILLAIVVFGVNKFNVTPDILIYAISLAIAVIPEGMVAVVSNNNNTI